MESSDMSKTNKKNKKQQLPVVVPKTVTDIQRIKLERLMQDPEKPVIIPDRKKDKKAHEAPEFVRNVMGSSAGAGSGEFHVYRHLRRKEYARQKHIDEKAKKEELDDEFQKRIEENNSKAERKTAQKRAKRPVFVLPIVVQDHKLRAILMPHQALSYIPLNLWELLGSPYDSPTVRSGEESLVLMTQLGASPSFDSRSTFKITENGEFVQLGLEILTTAKAVIDFAARQVTVGIASKKKSTLSTNNIVPGNVSGASLSDKFVEPKQNTDVRPAPSNTTKNIPLGSPANTLKTAQIILTPCDSIKKTTKLVPSHSTPQSNLSPDTIPNKKHLGRSDKIEVPANPKSNSQIKATEKVTNVLPNGSTKSDLKTSGSGSAKKEIVPTTKSKHRTSYSRSNSSGRTGKIPSFRRNRPIAANEYFKRSSSHRRYHSMATKRTSSETKNSAPHSKKLKMVDQSKALPLLPNPPSLRPVLLPTPKTVGRISNGNNSNKFGLLPTPFSTSFEDSSSDLMLKSTPYEESSPGLLPTPLSMSYEESSSGLLSRPISMHEPSFLKPSSNFFENLSPTYSRYSNSLSDDKPTGLLPTPNSYGESSLRPGALKNNALNGSTRSGLLPIPRNVSVNMDFVDCASGFSNPTSETYRDEAYYSEPSPKSEFSREMTELIRKQTMYCQRSCNKKTTRYCPFLKMPH